MHTDLATQCLSLKSPSSAGFSNIHSDKHTHTRTVLTSPGLPADKFSHTCVCVCVHMFIFVCLWADAVELAAAKGWLASGTAKA